MIHFFGLVLLGSARPRWSVAAIAMYVTAALLFLSALESARRVRLPRTRVDDPMPAALITAGSFALVRHPFYIAYSLAWLAEPVATHGPAITMTGILAVPTYMVAARREERLLEAHFGDAYRAYGSKAGLMVPSTSALVRAFR